MKVELKSIKDVHIKTGNSCWYHQLVADVEFQNETDVVGKMFAEDCFQDDFLVNLILSNTNDKLIEYKYNKDFYKDFERFLKDFPNILKGYNLLAKKEEM